MQPSTNSTRACVGKSLAWAAAGSSNSAMQSPRSIRRCYAPPRRRTKRARSAEIRRALATPYPQWRISIGEPTRQVVSTRPLLAGVASLALVVASRGTAETVHWRQVAEVSDLRLVIHEVSVDALRAVAAEYEPPAARAIEIGRASCRERG